MATRFQIDSLPLTQKQSPVPEFAWHTSERLSRLAQSKHLTFDIRSLDPDKYSYPYHYHHSSEELFVILEGAAMLRTPIGVEEVKAGDLLFFETGPSGAHQLFNHTDLPCKYLDIRTENGLDAVEYPDSGKINIMLAEQRIYDVDSEVDYFKGETEVRNKWKGLRLPD
ncbi:cupin domain-containing protein [Gorillibacterium timonense]|uniref:cupin domain-containing protein n=1 Tax=Gorillibacterium timonense TaxID=1689269 RepID=UPI00071D9792|nr:cupin domain-containing protein [Gorillibacterium timonense]